MDQPQLIMYRRDLLNLPVIEMPKAYAIRPYRDGDEQSLAPVFQACFDPGWSPERIIKTFIDQPCWSPGRMCVLCHSPASTRDKGEHVVGTATAWEHPEQRGHGMVHYVAVLPEHRGKRLGTMLVVRVLDLLERMGYSDAWLSTDDWRLAAIKVYLDLGFEPVHTHKSHPERWEIVRHKLALRHPNG